MKRSNRPPTNGHASPVRLFLITTALIFAAEALVMFFLPVLPPLSLYEEMIIDSLLLSLLISPLLHFTLFRPMVAEVTECRRADEEIRLLQTMTQTIAESKDFNTALEKWKGARDIAGHCLC
ncbi:MAG: hypothetical protein NUV74_06670 [Candidatus Brocadiaceae bacterium]|nr:hypothetical protein [Candidatus Brocadiaceae bacterium]